MKPEKLSALCGIWAFVFGGFEFEGFSGCVGFSCCYIRILLLLVLVRSFLFILRVYLVAHLAFRYLSKKRKKESIPFMSYESTRCFLVVEQMRSKLVCEVALGMPKRLVQG